MDRHVLSLWLAGDVRLLSSMITRYTCGSYNYWVASHSLEVSYTRPRPEPFAACGTLEILAIKERNHPTVWLGTALVRSSPPLSHVLFVQTRSTVDASLILLWNRLGPRSSVHHSLFRGGPDSSMRIHSGTENLSFLHSSSPSEYLPRLTSSTTSSPRTISSSIRADVLRLPACCFLRCHRPVSAGSWPYRGSGVVASHWTEYSTSTAPARRNTG